LSAADLTWSATMMEDNQFWPAMGTAADAASAGVDLDGIRGWPALELGDKLSFDVRANP